MMPPEFYSWVAKTHQYSLIGDMSIRRFNDWQNKTSTETHIRHWLRIDLPNSYSDGSNFTCELFRLIRKADPSNLARLRVGFPEECYAQLLFDHISQGDK